MTEELNKLFDFIENNNISEMKELLLTNHHLVNTKFNNDFTPLHLALKNDNLEIASFLLKNGAKPDIPDNYGYTPLHLAFINHFIMDMSSIEVITLLLENRANPNVTYHNQFKPLTIALINNNLEITSLLLNAGATFEDNSTLNLVYRMCLDNLYSQQGQNFVNSVFSRSDINDLNKILNVFDNNPYDSSDKKHDLLKVFFNNFNLDFPSYDELQDVLNKPEHLGHVKEALKDLDHNVAKAFLYEFDNGFYNTCNLTREQFINSFASYNLSKIIKFNLNPIQESVKVTDVSPLKNLDLITKIFSYLNFEDFSKIIDGYYIETENVKSDSINEEPSDPYNEETKTDLVGNYPDNTDSL